MRTRTKVAAAIALVAVVAFVFLAGYAYTIRAQAESLLKDLVALKVGSSTESDVQKLIKKHGRYLESQSYSEGIETTTFTVKNSWLSALRIEPPAIFGAAVQLRDGRVDHINAWLSRSMDIFPTFQASAGMVDEYSEYTEHVSKGIGHYGFPTPVGKPYLRVRLDSHATPSQRQHAWDFSFRCLVKPGGECDLPCDYLPSAWRDYRVYVNEVGLSDFFNARYAGNARCPE